MTKNHHLHFQIFEHEILRVGEVRAGIFFTESHWKQLLRLNEQQYPPYFQIVHQGIKALQYVGVISLDTFTLEILPKTERCEEYHSRQFLLEMAQKCGKLPFAKVNSHLSTHKGSLMEIFMLSFLKELETLISAGLIKRYRRQVQNNHHFSGRILLKEQIQKNCVHKDKVVSEKQIYDTRHIIHDFLQEALHKLIKISHTPQIHFKAKALLSSFPEASSHIKVQKLKSFKLTRNEAYYEKALAWANVLLYDLRPGLKFGSLSTFSFLLDMQQLFENYISQSLREIAREYGCQLELQQKSNFWKRRSIRPDMVLITQKGEKIILDTKWKLLRRNEPDDADLKQIYIYNRFFEANRGILIYPLSHPDQKGYSASYAHSQDLDISCQIAFVDIFSSQKQKLNMDWAHQLMQSILTKEMASKS